MPRPYVLAVLLTLVRFAGPMPLAAGAPADVTPDRSAAGMSTVAAAVATGAALVKQIRLRRSPARFFGGTVSPSWRDQGFDDRAWIPVVGRAAPRGGSAPGAAPPAGVTLLDVVPAGSLYVRMLFDVDHLPRVRALELRIVYQDAFVAYLNGKELTRRGLPAGQGAPLPSVAHGTEPERIFLPVPLPKPAEGQAATLRATDNVLAIEIRPAQGRATLDADAPSAEVNLTAYAGVRIVRGPYLTAPTDDAVSVVWETDLPARGRVRFRPEAEPESARVRSSREVIAARPALRQVARLTHLRPGTRYQYQVDVQGNPITDGAQSTPASFQTAPRPDQRLRFIVYGDMRAPGHAAHAQVVAGLLREPSTLIVNTGDLVAVGAEESAWQRYFEITAALGAIVPVVPALGNHEGYVGGAAKSWALFGLHSAAPEPGQGYTSFDWGGAHFVILDSNHPDTAQRDWLVRDLEKARHAHARAIFAICHDGPWSFGTHGGSSTMERLFAPVLAAGGTDVLFSGHDHLYARGTGVTARGPLPFIVTGGGGAPLYNPTCEPLATPAGAVPAGAIPSPLPTCPDTVAIIRKTYHYVVVEVDDHNVRTCARLPDGSPVEPCVDRPLRAAPTRAGRAR